MNNAGITAQYGFLFQRKAFVLFALENTGTKQTFTFEGKDDVEISTNECIYSVKTADSNYIQVKSGTVDESCFCKIICNWLLLDKIPSDTLILFAENQLEVPISNVTKDAILEYILKGKEKKKSSIARKTYNKFQDIIETDRDAFLEIIDRHLQAIKLQVCSMDNLDRRLESAFFDNYCQDTYEAAMKKVGLLEHIFIILSREVNTDRLHELEIKTVQLKKEIKILKSSFNQSKVKNFNVRLTELYLSTGLSIKHLQEDLQDNSFSLEFDPFRLCLFATHKDQEQLVRFMPGSMTRQTHLQMLTYLCMFEYLKDNFPDFIYLPILIIDSANQPMDIEIFKEVYPTITQLADSIGIQTIFMSKDRLDSVSADDFIDISTGLNKFHKKP